MSQQKTTFKQKLNKNEEQTATRVYVMQLQFSKKYFLDNPVRACILTRKRIS